MSVRIMAVLAVLAAALTLGGGAGAGTASQPPKKIDLSSPAAIDTYLRSIGVDPATVVKQNGLKNYAGPSCPGAGWTCTTSTRVVQVSHENSGEEGQGENEFQCKPDQGPPTDASTNTCVIVQGGTKNHAKCEEESSMEPVATQLCDITQTGARQNSAEVEQEIAQKSGGTACVSLGPSCQRGEQVARVTQEASDKNVSQIHQSVAQRTSVAMPQSQDAFQRVEVTQTVTGSENFSHVHQTQDQNESGSATSQTQNTAANTLGDCADDKVANPNQCANVAQYNNGGKNASHLHQAIGERQYSTAAVSQMQGDEQGGQEGDVHQQQNSTTSGENLDFPHQDLRQRQSSATGIHPVQTQATDPGCCGVGTQIGGVKNVEHIHQSTTQSASEGAANQLSTLFGQIHQVNDPANSCSIDQHGRNNSDAKHFDAEGNTAAECFDLELATQCTSSVEGGSCEEVNPCSVNPACDSLTIPAVLSLPTTPTFGRDIAMADYNGEPSDYFGP